MFLQMTQERNAALIETAAWYHRQGKIRPDTYVVDLDAVLLNASHILKTAKQCGIRLYFMTKQFGRNPLVAQALLQLGFDGAVAVDYKEAMLLGAAAVRLGHVGHLVQTPRQCLRQILAWRPEVMTVYSVEKALEIEAIARQNHYRQAILLRVWQEGDWLYPGQQGGFRLQELPAVIERLRPLNAIEIVGVTAFPCFLYDDACKGMKPTHNTVTLQQAGKMLAEHGITVSQLNMPSATCCHTLPLIAQLGGTHGEPGHGLLGSTPLHAANCEPEIPAMIYISEISHQWGGRSYCYGGGYYRRSHLQRGLAGGGKQPWQTVNITIPDVESIDYYWEINAPVPIGDTLVAAFRSQVFVTRSDVAVISGIATGKPRLQGIYDSQGQLLQEVSGE